MLKFEVGQPLPIPLLQPPGYEECRPTFNEAFFDLVYWIPASETDLIPIWRSAKLEYGIFIADDIPFFIINFISKNWNVDVSLNIKKVQQDKVEAWLNSEGNIINLFLCDCKINILLAMRMTSIQKEISEKIRDVLEKQDDRYASSQEVDNAINNIMQSYATRDMMQKTKMITL